jgi:hypothetical protein
MNDPDIPTVPPSAAPGPELVAQGDPESPGAPARDDAAQVDVAAPEVPQTGTAAAEPALPEPVPHAGARYALLRLLMLVAVGGILYLVGMRGWLLAFAAVLVSGIVSLFLFMKQRNDAAVNLERTVDGWKHRRDHEDAGLAPE